MTSANREPRLDTSARAVESVRGRRRVWALAGAIALMLAIYALAGGIMPLLPGIRVMTWKEAEREI